MKINKNELKNIIKEELAEAVFRAQDAAKSGYRTSTGPTSSGHAYTAAAQVPTTDDDMNTPFAGKRHGEFSIGRFQDVGGRAADGDEDALKMLYLWASKGDADAKAVLDAVLEENPKLAGVIRQAAAKWLPTRDAEGEVSARYAQHGVEQDPNIAVDTRSHRPARARVSRPSLKERLTRQRLKRIIKEVYETLK